MTTDSGSPAGFLARWSRRKLAPAQPEQPEAAPPAPAEEATPVEAPQSPAPDEPAPPPLPDIASIGADTDITPWLARGVPEETRLAALRRAWTETPHIRDFKGLQDYDQNFNDPDSIPGFGSVLDPERVKDMLARVFAPPEPKVAEEAEAAGAEPLLAGEQPPPALQEQAAAAEATPLPLDSPAEGHTAPPATEPRPMRRRGGALPA
jgi:hypothetical protein